MASVAVKNKARKPKIVINYVAKIQQNVAVKELIQKQPKVVQDSKTNNDEVSSDETDSEEVLIPDCYDLVDYDLSVGNYHSSKPSRPLDQKIRDEIQSKLTCFRE